MRNTDHEPSARSRILAERLIRREEVSLTLARGPHTKTLTLKEAARFFDVIRSRGNGESNLCDILDQWFDAYNPESRSK